MVVPHLHTQSRYRLVRQGNLRACSVCVGVCVCRCVGVSVCECVCWCASVGVLVCECACVGTRECTCISVLVCECACVGVRVRVRRGLPVEVNLYLVSAIPESLHVVNLAGRHGRVGAR